MIYAWLAGIAIIIFFGFGVILMIVSDIKRKQDDYANEIKSLIKTDKTDEYWKRLGQ